MKNFAKKIIKKLLPYKVKKILTSTLKLDQSFKNLTKKVDKQSSILAKQVDKKSALLEKKIDHLSVMMHEPAAILLDMVDHNNIGNEMMAINTIYYLNQLTGKNLPYRCLWRQERSFYAFKRLKTVLPSNNIRFDERRELLISKVHPDILLVLGGDCFSGSPTLTPKRYFEEYKNKQNHIILLGQNLGPYPDEGVLYLNHRLSYYNKIFLRDEFSYTYAKNTLGLENIAHVADLAFLDLPGQTEQAIAEILKNYNLEEKTYLVIAPSEFSEYASDKEKIREGWLAIAENILMHKKFKNLKIVLLGHVFTQENNDDRLAVDYLEKRLNDNRIVGIYDELTPLEARAILGRSLFNIAGRMHACINTLQMGTVAIPLAYSQKYYGIFEHEFDMGDLIIEAKGDVYWQDSQQLATKVMAVVRKVIENYDFYTKKIADHLPKLKKLALSQLEWTANYINEHIITE